MATNVEYIIRLRDKFSGKMGKVNKSARGLNKQMDGLGKSALRLAGPLAAGFAVVGIINRAKDAVINLDKELTSLQAITGLGKSEMGFFSKEARKMGGELNIAASDVAASFTLVGSKQPELLKNKEALASVTEQALILAKAAGIDGAAGAVALTSAMNQFGASASDAAKFTDIFATSQQKGSSLIAQTSSALEQVGASADAVGLSFETTNAAIQALAKGSITGGAAGTSLNAVLAQLSKQSDDKINPSIVGMSAALEELESRELSFKDATKLVQIEGAKGLLTLIKQRDTFEELNGSLNEVGNAMSQAEVNMGSLSEKTFAMGNSFDNLVLSVNEGSGAISKSIGFVADSFTNWFDQMTKINEAPLADSVGEWQAAFMQLGSIVDVNLAKTTERLADTTIRAKALGIAFDDVTKASEALSKASGVSIEDATELTLRRLEKKKASKKSLADSQKALEAAPAEDHLAAVIAIAKAAKEKADKEGKKVGGKGGTVSGTKIVSGAPKVFNINIDTLVGEINNKVTNMKEGMNESKKIVVEALLGAISDTQSSVR